MTIKERMSEEKLFEEKDLPLIWFFKTGNFKERDFYTKITQLGQKYNHQIYLLHYNDLPKESEGKDIKPVYFNWMSFPPLYLHHSNENTFPPLHLIYILDTFLTPLCAKKVFRQFDMIYSIVRHKLSTLCIFTLPVDMNLYSSGWVYDATTNDYVEN